MYWIYMYEAFSENLWCILVDFSGHLLLLKKPTVHRHLIHVAEKTEPDDM